MSNTLKLGNGKWATGKDTVLAYNDLNSNYKPLAFSFSRASSGTVINKDGLIETVGAGEPRIDFKDNTKGSLLLEPSRSNLVTYSEDLSTWTSINVDKTLTQVKNPSGNLGVYKIAANSTATTHYIELYPNSATSGVDYTFSFFAKINGSNFVQVALSTGFSALYQNFNLLDGTLGNGNLTSGYSSNIEAIGNGWYRISVKGNTVSETARFLTIPILTDIASRNPSFVGNGNLGIYVWGFQKEQGSYATSYIPTSGQANGVTRVADVCNNGANEQVINSTEGVLYAEIKGFISQDTTEPNRYITITNGTSNERVALLLGGNLNQLRAIIYSSTQSINLSFTTSLTDVKQFNKLAVKYKSGDYAFFLNGAKIGGSTETSIFSQNTLNDFSFDVGGGTQQFRGMVKDIKLYNTALTDQELIALTS